MHTHSRFKKLLIIMSRVSIKLLPWTSWASLSLRVGGKVGKRADGKASRRGAIGNILTRKEPRRVAAQVAARASPPASRAPLSQTYNWRFSMLNPARIRAPLAAHVVRLSFAQIILKIWTIMSGGKKTAWLLSYFATFSCCTYVDTASITTDNS